MTNYYDYFHRKQREDMMPISQYTIGNVSCNGDLVFDNESSKLVFECIKSDGAVIYCLKHASNEKYNIYAVVTGNETRLLFYEMDNVIYCMAPGINMANFLHANVSRVDGHYFYAITYDSKKDNIKFKKTVILNKELTVEKVMDGYIHAKSTPGNSQISKLIPLYNTENNIFILDEETLEPIPHDGEVYNMMEDEYGEFVILSNIEFTPGSFKTHTTALAAFDRKGKSFSLPLPTEDCNCDYHIVYDDDGDYYFLRIEDLDASKTNFMLQVEGSDKDISEKGYITPADSCNSLVEIYGSGETRENEEGRYEKDYYLEYSDNKYAIITFTSLERSLSLGAPDHEGMPLYDLLEKAAIYQEQKRKQKDE